MEQRGKGEQGGPGLLQAFLRIPVPFYKKGLGRFQLYLLNEEVGAWLGRDSYVRLAVPLQKKLKRRDLSLDDLSPQALPGSYLVCSAARR